MNFRTYAICRTWEGWQPVEVPSSSGEDVYVVLVNPWGDTRENICHCKGYSYRGECRHQQEAVLKLCHWHSLRPNALQQTPEQQTQKICPKCGGPTKYEVEIV